MSKFKEMAQRDVCKKLDIGIGDLIITECYNGVGFKDGDSKMILGVCNRDYGFELYITTDHSEKKISIQPQTDGGIGLEIHDINRGSSDDISEDSDGNNGNSILNNNEIKSYTDFKYIISNLPEVKIIFYAKWYIKSMTIANKMVNKNHDDNIPMYKVDIDDFWAKKIIDEYSIKSVPSIITINNGSLTKKENSDEIL